MTESRPTRAIALNEQLLKLMTIKGGIEYKERILKELKQHQAYGMFPKGLYSTSIPKMATAEEQDMVDKACHDLKTVVLCQKILEVKNQLAKDRANYEQRKIERDKDKRELPPPPPQEVRIPLSDVKAELED